MHWTQKHETCFRKNSKCWWANGIQSANVLHLIAPHLLASEHNVLQNGITKLVQIIQKYYRDFSVAWALYNGIPTAMVNPALANRSSCVSRILCLPSENSWLCVRCMETRECGRILSKLSVHSHISNLNKNSAIIVTCSSNKTFMPDHEMQNTHPTEKCG